MAAIQLEDLVYAYPAQDDPLIQQLVTAKKEFADEASSVTERRPPRGELFKHQRLIKKFMLAYDRILLIHRTGTGKSCAAFGSSEQFTLGLANAVYDFINLYLKPQRTHITHVYVLTKGRTLVNELKYQLACQCTGGQYVTDRVEKAPNDKERRRALTTEIRKFYTIKTYGTFALSLANMSDDEYRRHFSNSMFIIDEVQFLRIDPFSEYDREQQGIIYNTLWRIFHVMEKSKIMLLSATPMINDVNEIAPIMNLILPDEPAKPGMTLGPTSQLPLQYDYSTVTLEQLKPYFNGRISYVREADNGAIPIYEGVVIPNDYNIGGKIYDSQTLIYQSIMSDHQARNYIAAASDREPFREPQRQAANFVFPDGTSGGEGFNTYITRNSPDQYTASNDLLEWISDIESLRNLSAKFASVVELCHTQPGNCFCYTNFVVGGGAVLLGLCFQNVTLNAQKFKQFTEIYSVFNSVPGSRENRPFCLAAANDQGATRRVRPGFEPALRYALLTAETPETRRATILELFNSYENRHGDYLKVIIGSPISRVGLNLANVLQMHLVDPWWNQSSNYQAISRALRATSHIDLISEEQARIKAAGGNPDNASILVHIYQHASNFSPALEATMEDEEIIPVDISFYHIAEGKDIEIKRMERFMKQCSIDCHIHYRRNVRPNDTNGSAICDYDICDYQCITPAPPGGPGNDETSYDVLYADTIIDAAVADIKEIFLTTFSLSIPELYNILAQSYPPKYIDRAIFRIIFTKIPLTSAYGYRSYLLEDSGTLFLQREFPLPSTQLLNSYPLSYYSANLTALSPVPLSSYVTTIQSTQQQNILSSVQSLLPTPEAIETVRAELIAKIEDIPEDQRADSEEQVTLNDLNRLTGVALSRNLQFNEYIDSLTLDNKVQLLESALFEYVNSDNVSAFNHAVITKYRNLIFTFPEPVSKIQQALEQLSNRGKGRGRKPKSDSTVRLKKINPQSPKPSPDESDVLGESVYIHLLYLLNTGLTSYAVTSVLNKAEGRYRIYKPSENSGWRDTRQEELIVYNQQIQVNIQGLLVNYEQYPIYGTIYRADGKFRIRDKTNENASEVANDARKLNKGRICSTWTKPLLIEVLWNLGIPPSPNTPTSFTRDQLINSLNRESIPNLSTFSLDKLQFYYKWLSLAITRDHICDIIRDHLQSIGRLFVI